MIVLLILIFIILMYLVFVQTSLLTCVIRTTANVESLYEVIAKASAKEIAEKFAKYGYRIIKKED